MGRAVKIKGIRRERHGDVILVSGETGDFKWHLCGPATQEMAARIMRMNGIDPLGLDPFKLVVDPENPYVPQGKQTPPNDKSEMDGDSQGDDQGDGDGDSDGEGGDGDGDSDGEGGDGDGEGGGDGDDTPVMHSEVPELTKAILAAGGKVFAETSYVRSLAADAFDAIANLGDQVVALQAGGGQGGSGFLKIEVKTPTKVTIKDGLFHNQFPKLVRWVSSGNHVFLPGPPGTGKSHAAEQVADTLGWNFGSISLGPTTPESRLWGGKDANGIFHEPTFVQGARFAQDNPDSGFVMCLDEMDNGHPGILATLNSAMANGWFTAPNGDVIRMGSNWVIVAAANTYGTGPTAEFSGRNRLDAATLDRFLYLPWDTDLNVEKTLVHAHLASHKDAGLVAGDWLDVWHTARQNVSDNGLKVFVTMRGAINGAKLLAAGVTLRGAFDAVLGSKLPADQLKKIDPL